MKKITFLFICLLSSALSAQNLSVENNSLYTGLETERTSVQKVAETITPGSIVIISELHALGPHQDKQVEFMHALKNLGHTVSVAMEFLYYPDQSKVDAYTHQEISEQEFLKSIAWGKTDFNFYRRQILFSRDSGGRTLAINAPRHLTKNVARNGLASISEEDKKLMPPHFQLGNEDYFNRFWQAVGGDHVPREKADNYFAAQSIWDDTMAWKTLEHLNANPDDVVVIVVGDFHNIYGGGLPDRLRARGAENVVTISQVNLAFYESNSEALADIQPHPDWGPRADYVWTSSVNP